MTLTKDSLDGIYSALPTPNDPKSGFAAQPLKDFISYLIGQGVSGVVPVGGTGDYPALSPQIRRQAVEATVEAAKGKVQVIAGILAPGMAEAVSAGRDFKSAGADALMLITPYYVTATQAGMRDYFRAFRDAVDLPLIIFDIPGRTGNGLQPDTIAKLAEEKVVIGMKASSLDLNHFNQTVALAGENMTFLSGTDKLMLAHCLLGARGAVMTTASFVPAFWTKILACARTGDVVRAVAMHRQLMPLFDAFSAEPIPSMLNAGIGFLGFDMGPNRLPLLPPAAANVERVRKVVEDLRKAGILPREVSAKMAVA